MNDGERKFCDFQYGRTGGFYRALFDTAFRADSMNQARLAAGFPEEIKAVWDYQNTDGYWDRLRAEYFMSGEDRD
jgi:hypothetical protein